MKGKRLSRRDFLKIAGASTAIALPAISGYGMYLSAQGEFPPIYTPYISSAQESSRISELDGTSPILLLMNERSDNPFGAYLEEILRAEGLNCFHLVDISAIDKMVLQPYDILILAEGLINTNQAEILEQFVVQGGRIISMRPDPRLYPLLGVEKVVGILSDGYLKTDLSHPASNGINPYTLQFHGDADLYKLTGAVPVAWLYHDREVASSYPAVTINQYGNGLAAMWAYDLAKSIAYMRQGNPARANQDLDGLNGIRTVDLFVDWIDLDRISIPQADEQQRLFINLLTLLSQGKRPLPRIWYFPEDENSILIATGDSHMNPAPFIEEVFSRFDRFQGHMTVYYSPLILNDIGRMMRRAFFFAEDHFPEINNIIGDKYTSPTPLMVADWRKRGHEFALHPYVEESLERGWNLYWKEFTGRGYGPVPPTVRTHRILWSGWVETARVQASYGIRMNMDYYHVGPSLKNQTGEWVYGHLTGSGRPMKFIDDQGRILNIFQQLTQIADEHLIPLDVPGWGGWPHLNPAEAVEVAKYLFSRSVKYGDYCAIAAQFHVDPFQVGGEVAEKASTFLEGTLSCAQELGIPIWSAHEWLDFTEAKHDTTLAGFVWDSDSYRLRFEMLPNVSNKLEIALMIPATHDDKQISTILFDNTNMPYYYRTVGGVEYACVHVELQPHKVDVAYL